MKLPDKVFGIETSKAYKDYLERAKNSGNGDEQEPPEIRPAPSSIKNPDSYLILPGRKHGNYEYPDLLVSAARTHQGEDWNQAHESLKQEDSFMLTIRQYVDFLNMLKSGDAYDEAGKKADKKLLDGVLEEITAVRNPWRSEWLDAKFSSQEKIKKKWHITYHNHQGSEVAEPLENCLMSDKTPGIDLSYWLSNAASQGLPPGNNPNGSLYYWCPRDGAVARFFANSGWACLDCYRNPLDSYPALGVRSARRAAPTLEIKNESPR